MKKQISKKEENWMDALIAEEQAREARNAEALSAGIQKAQAQAHEEQAQKAQAQAQALWHEEQAKLAQDAEKMLEQAQRKIRAKGASHKDEKSPYGRHRLNSEGAQMDEILQSFHKAHPAAKMPSGEDMIAHAKAIGKACPYSAKRIKGHLDFLQRERASNLPDILRRG